jgi:hypothetical protein
VLAHGAKETLVIAASMQDGQCREAMIWIAKIAKGAQLAEERLKKRAPQNQEFHAL